MKYFSIFKQRRRRANWWSFNSIWIFEIGWILGDWSVKRSADRNEVRRGGVGLILGEGEFCEMDWIDGVEGVVGGGEGVWVGGGRIGPYLGGIVKEEGWEGFVEDGRVGWGEGLVEGRGIGFVLGLGFDLIFLEEEGDEWKRSKMRIMVHLMEDDKKKGNLYRWWNIFFYSNFIYNIVYMISSLIFYKIKSMCLVRMQWSMI